MKFSKKLKFILPISFVGTGLVAASIISTTNLLGIKGPTWNRAYNESKDSPVDMPENPTIGPSKYTDWKNVPYNQWSKWIGSEDANSMQLWGRSSTELEVGCNATGDFVSDSKKVPHPGWLGKSVEGWDMWQGHYWRVKKDASQAYSPSTNSVTSVSGQNVLSFHLLDQAPVDAREARDQKDKSSIGYNYKIGGDTRDSMNSFLGSNYGNSNNLTVWGSRVGTYGMYLNPKTGSSNIQATQNLDGNIKQMCWNHVGRDEGIQNVIKSLRWDMATYQVSRDHSYTFTEGPYSSVALGTKGSDGYAGAISFAFTTGIMAGGALNVIGTDWWNGWDCNVTAGCGMDHEQTCGFGIGSGSDNWNVWNIRYNQATTDILGNGEEWGQVKQRVMQSKNTSNAPFYSGSTKFYAPRVAGNMYYPSYAGQFFISYDGYDSGNMGLYTTKMTSPYLDKRVTTSMNYIGSEPSLNGKYPSQVIKDETAGVKVATLKYDLPSTYYLSRVEARYSDDLGKIEFKITWPSLKVYDNKLLSFKSYGYDTTNQQQIITISGFKNNSTNYNGNTLIPLPAENGSKVVASTLVTEREILDLIWAAMTKGYYQTDDGDWRNDEKKNDYIMNNWDRIEGFTKDDINIISCTYNMVAGSISVKIKPKKYISVTGEVKTDDNGPQGIITINGFQQVHHRTSINLATIALGNGDDINTFIGIDKSAGIDSLTSLLYKYSKEHIGDEVKALYLPMDEKLLEQKPFKVVDYMVNPTQGTIDVSLLLKQVYDPSIDPQSPVEVKNPVIEKVRITGYRGKETKFLETNTTTKLFENKLLISQKAYNNSPGGNIPAGIEIKMTKAGYSAPNTTTRDKGYGGNIQSIYYDQIQDQFLALAWNQDNGKMIVAQHDTPYDFYDLNPNYVKYVTDDMTENTSLSTPSLNSSMRMVPLNNDTGIPHSYIVFPTFGSGVATKNDPVFIISFDSRRNLLINKLDYGNFCDDPDSSSAVKLSSIIAMGGYDNGMDPDGNHKIHLSAVVAKGTKEIQFKSLDFDLPNRDAKKVEVDETSLDYKAKTETINTLETDVMKYCLNEGESITSLPTYGGRNLVDLYQVNLPTVKKEDGTYSSVWTRMKYVSDRDKTPTYETWNINYGLKSVLTPPPAPAPAPSTGGSSSTTKPSTYASTTEKYLIQASKFDIYSDATQDLANLPTLFKPNGFQNVYVSTDQSKIFYNLVGKKAPTKPTTTTPTAGSGSGSGSGSTTPTPPTTTTPGTGSSPTTPTPPTTTTPGSGSGSGSTTTTPGSGGSTTTTPTTPTKPAKPSVKDEEIYKKIANNAFVCVYDIKTGSKFITKIGDVGATDEQLGKNSILMPDQGSLNSDYILSINTNDSDAIGGGSSLDYATNINKSEKFYSRILASKNTVNATTNMFEDYEKYENDPEGFKLISLYPIIDKQLNYIGINNNISPSDYYKNISIGSLNWNFDKGTLEFPVTISNFIDAKLNTGAYTTVFTLKYTVENTPTSVVPKPGAWGVVNITDLGTLVDELNAKTKKYADYFDVKSGFNSSAMKDKPEVIDVAIKTTNDALETAELAVTVNTGLAMVNGSISKVDSLVLNVTVDLKKNLQKLPDSINISSNGILSAYPPSELVAVLNGNGTESDYKNALEQIKQVVIKSIGAEKVLKPVDIAVKSQYNFNNALGIVKTYISIPKWIGNTPLAESPYFEKEIALEGFKSFPATTVAPVSFDKVKAEFPSDTVLRDLAPSDIQDYLNSKWYNIYKFITIQNQLGNKLAPWIVWTVNADGEVIKNPNFNQAEIDTYDQKKVDELKRENTMIQAKVLKPVDNASGSVKLEAYIQNGFSADDNSIVYKQPDGTYKPSPEAVSTQRIDITGLASTAGGINTNFPTKIVYETIDAPDLAGAIPSNILEDTKLLAELTNIIIKKGTHVPPGTEIKILKSVANNKQGLISLEFAPSKIEISGSGAPEDNKNADGLPRIIFSMDITGFGKIRRYTDVIYEKNPIIDCHIYDLESKLFDKDGNVNKDTGMEYINRLVNIVDAPTTSVASLIESGSVVNVNVQAKIARVKFRLKDYYARDKMFSLQHGYEVALDVKAESDSLYVLGLETRSVGEDGSLVTKYEKTAYGVSYEDFETQLTSVQVSNKYNWIILSCSVFGLIALTALSLIYLKKQRYSAKSVN